MASANQSATIAADQLSQGSVWRRWDLHIHSPLSVLNNQFPQLPAGQGPDWEPYIKALEGLSNVAVVGITDYFSIVGYRAVAEFRRAGRLANIQCILPNVELRLGTFVVHQKSRDINLHVIFSGDLPPDEIEEEFIKALPIQVSGGGGHPGGVRQLTERTLIQVGQEIWAHHEAFRNDGDVEAAVKNITVALDDVQRLLQKNCFKNRHLLVLSGSEWGGRRSTSIRTTTPS